MKCPACLGNRKVGMPTIFGPSEVICQCCRGLGYISGWKVKEVSQCKAEHITYQQYMKEATERLNKYLK